MKSTLLRLVLACAGASVLTGCIAALAPAAVVSGQKSGVFSENEDDLYKIIARQYGVNRSTFKISDIDQQKHWNTTETYFNVTFNSGKKLRCNVSSAFGSNGDMALCDDPNASGESKCDALSKAAAHKCK